MSKYKHHNSSVAKQKFCNTMYKLNIVIIHFMTKSTITSEKIYLCVKSS